MNETYNNHVPSAHVIAFVYLAMLPIAQAMSDEVLVDNRSIPDVSGKVDCACHHNILGRPRCFGRCWQSLTTVPMSRRWGRRGRCARAWHIVRNGSRDYRRAGTRARVRAELCDEERRVWTGTPVLLVELGARRREEVGVGRIVVVGTSGRRGRGLLVLVKVVMGLPGRHSVHGYRSMWCLSEAIASAHSAVRQVFLK